MKRCGVLLLLTAGVPAQSVTPVPAGAIAAELASGDAIRVAKAADAARTQTAKELDRALVAALLGWAKRADQHAVFARLFLLDAMIARGIEAPGELLAPMLDEPMAHGAALVLVCRAPLPNERLLLDRFRAGKDAGCWREAEGNLLAANRAPGFAALLWQDAKTQPRITVDVLVPSGFDVGLGFCGPAALAAPAGFPRTPYYTADSGERPGAVAIVPGPFAVAFVRTNADAVATAISLPSIVQPTRELAWLEAMAGLPSDGGAEVALRFTTPETYRTEAAAARDRLLARRRALHAALVQRHALTAEEAALCTIPDAVEIVDARSDRSKPLPALPPAAR